MKYVLDPDNRGCSDDVLLDDLRQVANQLGRNSLTKALYNGSGRFSAATMQKRFGSWNTALERTGLDVAKRISIPNRELLEDLKIAARTLGVRVLTTADYSRIGNFSVPTVQRAFGSWQRALEEAELEVSEAWHLKTPDEELHSNLATVWEFVGRQPMKSDMVQPISRVSAHSYVRRFGSWRSALQAFVAVANQSETERISEAAEAPTREASTPAPRRTPRDPGWKLRFIVNRRDHFRCCACSRSPATHYGVVLHVDHVVPWREGGETVLGNLQTLCEVCNIGKGSLLMHGAEG